MPANTLLVAALQSSGLFVITLGIILKFISYYFFFLFNFLLIFFGCESVKPYIWEEVEVQDEENQYVRKVRQRKKFFIVNEIRRTAWKIRSCIVLIDATAKTFVANEHQSLTFVFTFIVVVDLPTDCILRECLCKSGPVDFAWDTDLAHFLCVVRHSCTYAKTTLRLIGSLYFSEFYGN